METFVASPVDWTVKPLKSANTFESAGELRARSREFARMAAEARDPVVMAELQALAREYEQYADTLEQRPRQARDRERAYAGSRD